MKTASLQPQNHLLNNRINFTYHIEFSPLTNIYTNIMKKLTEVSPFIMLLVPLFMMLVLTVSQGTNTTVNQKSAQKNAIELNSKVTEIQAPVK